MNYLNTATLINNSINSMTPSNPINLSRLPCSEYVQGEMGSLFHWDPGNQINPSNSINPSNCSTATRHNSSTPFISQGFRRKARGATAKLKCLRSKERSPCGTQDVSSPSPTGVFYSSITRPVLPNARFHGASSRFEAKLEPPTRETQSTQ